MSPPAERGPAAGLPGGGSVLPGRQIVARLPVARGSRDCDREIADDDGLVT
jgi:hypothetical protein